jgi:hypothetical protein
MTAMHHPLPLPSGAAILASQAAARSLAGLFRRVAPLWLAWTAVLLAFQWLVVQRVQLRRPDVAVIWSAPETAANSQNDKPYLLEPRFNRQVSWDSEFYLSIAVAGYDDPAVRALRVPGAREGVPLNYAFFPLYPVLIWLLAVPLGVLGLPPIATASLAGIAVSLVGTLFGLAALYDLARAALDETAALRASFYLLAFPTSFFLAMVYTEGVFVGLSFWALALSRRGHWLWASLLAALAALTRAQGAALAVALAVAWWLSWRRPTTDDGRRQAMVGRPSLVVTRALLAFLPLAVFVLWRLSPLGQGWALLQEDYFGRGLLPWRQSLTSWQSLLGYAGQNGPALIYAGLEAGAVALALVASLAWLRRDPALALYSLALVAVSALSGVAQSMARYMLVVPAVYLALARLGRWAVFDRAWTLLSVLLLGLEAMLFSFDMWVG